MAQAQGDDHVGNASQIDGEHFTIYYKQGVDIERLIDQLSVSRTDEILSGLNVDRSSNEKTLSSIMEVFFKRASDILDLHVYSFKGSIKIFPTMTDLTQYYNNLYHTHLPCTGYAFYLVDYKSIYISAEYFRREVLGHEMGHAIMSSYFVVQPSVTVQEVLAGYVEYQLRKSK